MTYDDNPTDPAHGGKMTDTMTDNHVHELWARAWTERVARAAGGLTYSAQCDVFLILHEIRRRVAAGDYSPPPPRESAQMDLLK